MRLHDNDDDELESSIHDLDHAPEIPHQHYEYSTRSSPPDSFPQPRSRRHSLSEVSRRGTSFENGTRAYPQNRRRSLSEQGRFADVVDRPPFVSNVGSGQNVTRKSSPNSIISMRDYGRFSPTISPHLSPDIQSTKNQTPNAERDSDKHDGGENLKAPRSSSRSDEYMWNDVSESFSEDQDTQDDAERSCESKGRSMGRSRGGWIRSMYDRLPSKNKVALVVTSYAPCFCFIKPQQHNRAILARLNVLLSIFSLYQVGAAIFLLVVVLGPNIVDRNIDVIEEGVVVREESEKHFESVFNVWNLNTFMMVQGFVAFVVCVAAFLTWRVVRDVDLLGALRYYWTLAFLISFSLFCAISLFDIYGVTGVWVQHWWATSALAWFRYVTCEPQDTYSTLCVLPNLLNVTAEEELCRAVYNSTNCTEIRDNAQAVTTWNLSVFYYFSGAWALIVFFMIILTLDTLEYIVSKPLVQRSRETNIPGWLALPFIGCLIVGSILTFSTESTLNAKDQTNFRWYGPLFMATGFVFLVGMILGWHSSNLSIVTTNAKRRKLLTATGFVGAMVIGTLFLAVLFVTAIVILTGISKLTDEQRGNFACSLDQEIDCTGCDLAENRCPEWSTSDVETLARAEIKFGATIAGVFLLYSLGATRYSLTLLKHIATYQIEFV